MKELRRLLPYIFRYKKMLYAGLLFVTISNLCSTYAPRVVGEAIDLISSRGFSENQILYRLAILIALTAGSGLFMYLTRRTIIVASRLIEYDLRQDLLFAASSRPMAYYSKTSPGDLMSLATNDIPAAREFLGPAIMYGANTLTTFAFALYFMLQINAEITVVALAPLPLLALTTYVVGKKVHAAFLGVQNQFAELTRTTEESIGGVRVVRAYEAAAGERAKFKAESKLYYYRYLTLARIESVAMPLFMALVGVAQLLVLAYGGWKVINGASTIGEMTQYFIYINLLIWPVAAIGWVTNLVWRAAASAKRLGELLDSTDDSGELVAPVIKPNIEGAIEFRNVSFRFDGAVVDSLKNVNFSIKPGETLGVTGSIGSGKSTLASLIPRLYEPASGAIYIDGKPLDSIPKNAIRNAVSFVTQETFLFSDTIEGNIKFGAPEATKEEVVEISKKAQLYDEVLTFPQGFDTMLGERGVTLSGGQKQRTSIARALLRNPKILILDDAFSAIDTKTESALLSSLADEMKKRSTIIISHRISAIKNADNIIVLDSGSIVEQGSHDELMQLGGKYSELFNRQQLEEEISGI